MCGSRLHRQWCMSPKSTSITRASPQCHDFRCHRDTAVVWKFAHLVHILVTTGIDSRVHLMAHPYAALCARRCRLITQFESQTSRAPCHSSCTNPCARFGYNQRVRNNNWQRMSPPTLVDQSTTHRHAARTIAVYIHRPNRTTEVRTARACRGTSLCNLRVHSFPQLPEHQTGTSNSACTRTASSWLHTMHRNTSSSKLAPLI